MDSQSFPGLRGSNFIGRVIRIILININYPVNDCVNVRWDVNLWASVNHKSN